MKYSIYFAILLLASCASLDEMHQKIMHRIPTYLSNGIFVSVSTGHDTNSGTNRLEPVKNVQTGISNAVKLGITNIYIARGVYTPGNGLNAATYGVTITNNNLHISGGYETDFRTIRVGYSEWDCQKLFGPVVSILNSTNITIDKVVIYNGQASAMAAGVDIDASSNIYFMNTIVSNNTNFNFATGGGGFRFNASKVALSNVQVNDNFGWTGGLFVYNTEYYFDRCLIYNNLAYKTAGAINFHFFCRGTLKNSIIRNNVATNYGGLVIYHNYYAYVFNNVVTNNYPLGPNNASIFLGADLFFTNLILSNNLFGGTNRSSQYMIYEQSPIIDFTNHVIIDNVFITNTIGFLYYDDNGSNIISNENWTNINITNYTGAAVASGNRVTNM